jgi:chromosomal replication initiation ATPase DnaA
MAAPSIEVRKILYRGNYQILPNPLQIGDISDHKPTGGKAAKIFGHVCPRCQGNLGHIFREEDGWLWFCGTSSCLTDDVSYQQKDKKETKDSEDASQVFSIGPKFYGVSLAKWRAEPNHQSLISAWIKKPENFLIVQGMPKTGKTFLCVALANHFLSQKQEFFYLRANRFFENIQQAINSGRLQHEAVRNMASKRLIAFDGLGEHSSSEWHKEMLFEFFDYRTANLLPTIVTTSYNWGQLQDTFGKSIYSRLNDEQNIKITVLHR